MKRIQAGILVLVACWGCSSLDFFQYRENTGLYTVEKPEGYGSSRFGAHIAVTSVEREDFMAVSGGRGQKTVFYRLAVDGRLRNVSEDDPLDYYPTEAEESERNVKNRGSSASLVGLPVWARHTSDGRDTVSGCVAVGEPDAGNVTVFCQSHPNTYLNIKPGGLGQFGEELAAIRPGTAGGQWLLAAAGDDAFAVFSTEEDRSDIQAVDNISELAAGRVLSPDDEDLVFVAAAAHDDRDRYRILVFVQTAEHSAAFVPVGCIADDDTPGLGGIMVTGDLDGNGSDELVASAAKVDSRKDSVHIFDVAGMLADYRDGDPEMGAGVCDGEADGSVHAVAVIEPRDDDDVECRRCGFGTALAIGDIATDDGGPELAVGAHEATAKGVEEAGAVFIYRGWERSGVGEEFEDYDLAGRIFDSSPKEGKEFGGNLAIGPMAGRNELLVGVTSGGQVVVAFCTGVGNNIETGGDVTTNGDGKVVSTRCRQ